MAELDRQARRRVAWSGVTAALLIAAVLLTPTLRRIGGARDGAAIVEDLTRGPEAYLQMWERAEGIKADPCRNPGMRLYAAKFRSLVRPMTTHQVMRAVGQPYTRLGSRFGYYAKTTTSSRVSVRVEFGPGGVVRTVR